MFLSGKPNEPRTNGNSRCLCVRYCHSLASTEVGNFERLVQSKERYDNAKIRVCVCVCVCVWQEWHLRSKNRGNVVVNQTSMSGRPELFGHSSHFTAHSTVVPLQGSGCSSANRMKSIRLSLDKSGGWKKRGEKARLLPSLPLW